MQVQNVSFGARYVKSATILKNNKNIDKYKIALVELDPRNIKDVICVNKLNLDWGYKESITYAIAQNINNNFMEITDVGSTKYFALTQQKKEYDDLNSDDILSIAEISDSGKKVINIDIIETHPEESHVSPFARFKHIGTEMIDNMKLLFRGKDLLVETSEENEPFYFKQGFEKIEGGVNRMIFKSIKF